MSMIESGATSIMICPMARHVALVLNATLRVQLRFFTYSYPHVRVSAPVFVPEPVPEPGPATDGPGSPMLYYENVAHRLPAGP